MRLLALGITVVAASASCGRLHFDVAGTLDDSQGSGNDGADPPPAASCAALPPSCGPLGMSSCCDSPTVPGGTFYRSYDAADGMFPDMTNPAAVSTFRLDAYEVTVGRFRQFLDAGGGTQVNPPADAAGAHPNLGASGWVSSWNANLPADTTALRAAVSCDPTFQT